MTYFVKYWLDDEETVATVEELAIFHAQAKARHWEIILTEITPTEMHFTAYEIEENI